MYTLTKYTWYTTPKYLHYSLGLFETIFQKSIRGLLEKKFFALFC